MIDLRLFRIPRLQRVAGRSTVLTIFVAVGYFLFVAQYLQLVLGLSPLQAGLWSLPSAIGFIVGSHLAPRVVPARPPGRTSSAPRPGAGGDRALASSPRSADGRPRHRGVGLAHHLARPCAGADADDRIDRRERRRRSRPGPPRASPRPASSWAGRSASHPRQHRRSRSTAREVAPPCRRRPVDAARGGPGHARRGRRRRGGAAGPAGATVGRSRPRRVRPGHAGHRRDQRRSSRWSSPSSPSSCCATSARAGGSSPTPSPSGTRTARRAGAAAAEREERANGPDGSPALARQYRLVARMQAST